MPSLRWQHAPSRPCKQRAALARLPGRAAPTRARAGPARRRRRAGAACKRTHRARRRRAERPRRATAGRPPSRRRAVPARRCARDSPENHCPDRLVRVARVTWLLSPSRLVLGWCVYQTGHSLYQMGHICRTRSTPGSENRAVEAYERPGLLVAINTCPLAFQTQLGGDS